MRQLIFALLFVILSSAFAQSNRVLPHPVGTGNSICGIIWVDPDGATLMTPDGKASMRHAIVMEDNQTSTIPAELDKKAHAAFTKVPLAKRNYKVYWVVTSAKGAQLSFRGYKNGAVKSPK